MANSASGSSNHTQQQPFSAILAAFIADAAKNEILLRNLVVNTRGLQGHGVAVDLFLEHQICWIKCFLKGGQALSTVKDMALLGTLLAAVRLQIRAELELASSSSHSEPDREEDMNKAVQDILKKQWFQQTPPNGWTSPLVEAGKKVAEGKLEDLFVPLEPQELLEATPEGEDNETEF